MQCIDGVKGHAGVSWGQPEVNYLEMPYGYQIWQEEPLTKVYCIAGSKVMQASAGVNQGSNCLEMPYGFQIW